MITPMIPITAAKTKQPPPSTMASFLSMCDPFFCQILDQLVENLLDHIERETTPTVNLVGDRRLNRKRFLSALDRWDRRLADHVLRTERNQHKLAALVLGVRDIRHCRSQQMLTTNFVAEAVLD